MNITHRIAALILVLPCLALIPSRAVAQSAADDLYFSVQNLQQSLGESAAADQIRDRFQIRALETQSAAGALADPGILYQVQNQFQTANNLSPELETVKQNLSLYLQKLSAPGSSDFLSSIANLTPELTPVDLNVLRAARDRAVSALQQLDEFDAEELSLFGRYYLNKRLEFDSLLQELAELPLEIEQVDLDKIDQDSNEDHSNETAAQKQARRGELQAQTDRRFFANLNQFRQKLAAAKQRFGYTSTLYDNSFIASAERHLIEFEKNIEAYLVDKSTGAKQRLRNELEKRILIFKTENGVINDANSRLFQAELGRWLSRFSLRGQNAGFDTAARRLYSKPNLKLTVQESLANRLAAQAVSSVDHVDQVIVGSRAQGWSYTRGNVHIDFLNDAQSAHVNIALSGTVQSSTYTKEGPVTAYTSSFGDLYADRSIRANVGNVTVDQPRAWAQIRSVFRGTNSIRLIERIALGRFTERQARAEEVASERAQAQLLGQFTDQTDEALQDGLSQLDNTRSQRGEFNEFLNTFRQDFSSILAMDQQGKIQQPIRMVDPFVLPRVAVTTTDTTLHVSGTLEGDNRLAATTEPPQPLTNVDVRVQIHESMLSNLVAPLIQNRLIQNWQFPQIVEGLSSGSQGMPDVPDDRRWAIQFEDGRPIQVEFDGNEIGVTVFGKEFRQERRRFTDPIKISIRYRFINQDGNLKLVPATTPQAEFTLPLKEGGRFDAEAIAFRQFLQDNLDEAFSQADPADTTIDLPGNLLPLDFVTDDEIRKRLEGVRLVELMAENGWLTIGWNYSPGTSSFFASENTPAIWDASPLAPDRQPGEEENYKDVPGVDVELGDPDKKKDDG